MLITKVNLEDLHLIEECGKKCLPIYFKKKELFFIINSDSYNILKIHDNNLIYGFIILEILNHKNHIMSFGVYPEFRRKGFGKLLINKVKELSENKLITLNVQKSNEVAISFYKKNGFDIKKELINYYDNLDCKDAYHMEYLNQCNITKNTKMIA